MAILRVNKTKDYTTMSNYHFKDKRLSLKAKGLLSEMLSLPEDWDYSIAGLVAINKEKETSIKSTLDELKQFGYLIVTKLMPNQTESGRYEYVYDIYEMPKKQEGDFLGVEFLPVENIGLYKYTNNKITKDKEEISKEESIYDYYQNKIGVLNPNQYEMFNDLIDKHGEDKIKDAIDTTISYGGNTLGYVIKVLQGNKKDKKEVSVPEWMNKDIQEEKMSPKELEELKKEMEIFND